MGNPIASSVRPDVLIIGGGIIGSSIALRLARAGLRVTVVDRGDPTSEATRASAGMLAPQGEMVEPDDFFHFSRASRDLYPAFLDELESLTGERVDYHRDGTLLVAADEKEMEELERVHRAQTQLGLPIERLAGGELRRRVAGLSPNLAGGLFVPGDHWLDSQTLARAVVQAAEKAGATFLRGLSVTGFNASASRLESVLASQAPSGAAAALAAGSFVLAAGCWSGRLAGRLGLRLPVEPCRGQMLELEVADDWPLVVRSGMHYLVPRPGRRVLVGTTSEYTGFESSVTAEGLRSILQGVLRFAPAVKDFRFRTAWAGLRPDTPDHLPALGPAAWENLIFATGHFRNGILLAPATAQWIGEWVLNGQTSRSLERYRPARFIS
jgi:glycine oxidase